MSWNRACEGGHVDVGTGRFSLVSVLTVLHVWKYDFHLWQRSVGACQQSPRRRAFLPPKMTHPGFKRKTWKACHLPGPRAKRRVEELTSFSLPTSPSAQHPSPPQPQLTFLLGAKGTSPLQARLCQQSQISAPWCLPSFPGEHPKPPLSLEHVGRWGPGENGSVRA